jgi:Type I restriction enzyme R protein N terminus (HSDR_N)
MVQFIQAQKVSLNYLEERFQLQQVNDEVFFNEWLDNLPENTDSEKNNLDLVKTRFLRLIKRPPLLEDTVKLVVVSPLLSLAGFYDEPFFIDSEESVEISIEDQDEIIRGRIDVLVFKEQLWLLVVESKRASFSLIEAIPQALAYMLANPYPDKPVFGLVTNGEDFQFLKLLKRELPIYELSDKFTLSRRENELYKVLAILKKLGQLVIS